MNSLLDYQAAAVGFAVAFLLVVLLTPVVSLAASRAGVLDRTDGERRMHTRPLPRLGGIAIFAGIAIPCAAFGSQHGFWGVMLGAALMCALGAVDDIVSIPPGPKLAGQIAIAAIPVTLSGGNISIDHVTLPFIGVYDLGPAAYPVTILWIVAIANIVNFIDGMDGLAAGFCAIAAMTFAILSASLGHADTAAVAAVVAGAAIGFLRYNFHPATIIMGDSGSLMLGYLLATLAIEGVLKTAAAVSLVFPLVVLALPILDTSFVILKRLKYRQPIYQADRWHLPPPLREHRLLAAPHGPHPLRVVHRAVDVRARDSVRPGPPARLEPRGGRRPRHARARRAPVVGVRDLHARDHQAAPPAGPAGRPRRCGSGLSRPPCGLIS